MTATYPPAEPIWCAGCGHYGVQASLDSALDTLGIPRHETMILAGIGCSGTIQNNLGTYGYHALHGRVLPSATGVALADPSLTVIAAGGDGDGYAIGMGHLVHAFRRNVPLTYLVMNNAIYGLTKGQRSPTSARSDDGATAFDAISMGLSVAGSTFLARGFTRRSQQLDRLTAAALEHARSGRGFAFLEILSPCVNYNDTYPEWEASLFDVDADATYDPTDRASAFRVVAEQAAQGRMPVGLIYRGGSDGVEQPATTTDGARGVRPRPAAAEVDPSLHAPAIRKLLDAYRL
ncbi:MAG: thiamine pyrophosphate-dependent enzyme [Candidatus Limnocylindrales bacterium]